jgi:hypothetical protein
MGIIKRVERSEKSTVEERSEHVTPELRPDPRQFEAARCLNSGVENLRRFGPARKSVGEVALRDHRLMSYRTLANWPPVWTPRRRGAGGEIAPVRASLRGEIGTLKEAHLATNVRPPRIYLIVTHEGSEYIGSLLFDNALFCQQICEFLKQQIGKTISETGGLDVSHLA